MLCAQGPKTIKSKTFVIPEDIRHLTTNPGQTSVTFQFTDPIHALVSMLHFNPLAADNDNLCFTYEKSRTYDDFCNGDRMKRIQVLHVVGLLVLRVVLCCVFCVVCCVLLYPYVLLCVLVVPVVSVFNLGRPFGLSGC
jgi:hypothetical protein